jgi:hypothetical protein
MASYARRTCSVCGIILPQPQMRRKKVRRRVGEGIVGWLSLVVWALGWEQTPAYLLSLIGL